MSYPLVRDLAAEGIPVRLTCGVLGFSPPGVLQWGAGPSPRDPADALHQRALAPHATTRSSATGSSPTSSSAPATPSASGGCGGRARTSSCGRRPSPQGPRAACKGSRPGRARRPRPAELLRSGRSGVGRRHLLPAHLRGQGLSLGRSRPPRHPPASPAEAMRARLTWCPQAAHYGTRFKAEEVAGSEAARRQKVAKLRCRGAAASAGDDQDQGGSARGADSACSRS